MKKSFSIIDKLHGFDYVWTILFSLFFYLFIYKIGDYDSIWVPFIMGLGIKYIFSVITRLTIEEISVPFNIFVEIPLYVLVCYLTTLLWI